MAFTLLIADDSPTIQRVVQLTFADEDATVVAVSDGDQAIARIEAEPPHIVIADADMPGKNGYDVARHIRQSPRLAHIPVVVLTGALGSPVPAGDSGCDATLAKPIEPHAVLATVHDLLAQKRASPPSAAVPAMPTLADAFAALLEAEQRGTDPEARAIWPAGTDPAPVVSDDVIDDIVQRVLDRIRAAIK